MRQNYLIPVIAILIAYSTSASGQANRNLSNLLAPVAVNVPLLPKTNNTYTIGNATLGFKSIYLADALFLKGNLTVFSPGTDNFFVGRLAGNTSLTGTGNTGVSGLALSAVTTGINNTATGHLALRGTTTGSYNTAIGAVALNSNETGSYNTATGFRALRLNRGSSNTATGSSALEINGPGSSNTAVGASALYNNSTGNYNTAVGVSSVYNNGAGSENVGVGFQSLHQNLSGIRNTAVGNLALNQTKTGHNTAIGYAAGYLYAHGDYNTFVGSYAGNSAAGYRNSAAFGYFARATGNNQIRIGSNTVTSIGGFTGWTNLSDGRFKKDVKEDVIGLAFINHLRPITYFLDINGLNKFLSPQGEPTLDNTAQNDQQSLIAEKEKIRYTGFVAQEVEKTARESNYTFSGVDVPKNKQDVYGLRYAEFVVPLVKAVQELSAKNDEKSQEIEELRKEVTELKKAMESIARNLNVDMTGKLGSISQNLPNPSKSSTSIQYSLPEKFRGAMLMVLDAGGKEVKKIILSDRQGTVTINTNMMASGTYSYSLVIDGTAVQTKKMILAR